MMKYNHVGIPTTSATQPKRNAALEWNALLRRTKPSI